jgi:maltose O-acetyltransferase
MKTEKEKMLAGELYNASDPVLEEERRIARLLCKKYSDSTQDESDLRKIILVDLIGQSGDNLWIEPPFFCDYGGNISTGKNVFMNFNCVILDVCPVTIGDETMLGPNVQIYTATHPINWKERANILEFGKPISIGSNVWVGGGAIFNPGVSIGDRSVIGAGSVITKDIPADVFATGNPCKVIKSLK